MGNVDVRDGNRSHWGVCTSRGLNGWVCYFGVDGGVMEESVGRRIIR